MRDIIEEEMAEEYVQDLVREGIDRDERLSEEEKQVLRLRFGLVDSRFHTPEELYEELGVTPEDIHRIATKVLSRPYRSSRRKKLKDFLD